MEERISEGLLKKNMATVVALLDSSIQASPATNSNDCLTLKLLLDQCKDDPVQVLQLLFIELQEIASALKNNEYNLTEHISNIRTYLGLPLRKNIIRINVNSLVSKVDVDTLTKYLSDLKSAALCFVGKKRKQYNNASDLELDCDVQCAMKIVNLCWDILTAVYNEKIVMIVLPESIDINQQLPINTVAVEFLQRLYKGVSTQSVKMVAALVANSAIATNQTRRDEDEQLVESLDNNYGNTMGGG